MRLCVLGSACVGKSSIITRFTENTFTKKYEPTLVEEYAKTVLVDAEEFHLVITDTTDQPEYRLLTEEYMKQCDGVLLVYSVNNTRSLNDTKRMYERAKRICGNEQLPAVLFANKVDVLHRTVPAEAGQAFAEAHNLLYLEGSALTGDTVEFAFAQLVLRVNAAPQRRPLRRQRKCEIQ